ncbi:uncharacterized protein unc [Drosophila tropicalis]|uniref:uncharacterized protein unc n=1 Tax=Drosophila tropicalis TaxID=46794 RepID=UPI0035ABEA50
MKMKPTLATKKPVTLITATAATSSAGVRVQQRNSGRDERVKRDQEEQQKRVVGGKRRTTTTYHPRQQIKSKSKSETCVKQTRSAEDTVNNQEQEKANEIAVSSQLKQLACLSEDEFEKGFRQWMDQEGIAREMHAQLRMDLINSFNKSSLGRLLSKTAVAVKMNGSPHCLLLSPLSMALHTLVAEFLHVQNCHYTLSVYCSEIPHRHALPDFEGHSEFRFSCEELKDILTSVLGEEKHAELKKAVQNLYLDTQPEKNSLLLSLVKSLVDSQSARNCNIERSHASTMTVQEGVQHCTFNQDTEALVGNSKSNLNIDSSQSYGADKNDTITGNSGRDVFVGPRLSESLHNVEKLLGQLIKQMLRLSQSCAPPVEIVSQTAFQSLLRQELDERERLQKLGKTINPEDLVTQLPFKAKATTCTASGRGEQKQDQGIAEVVETSAGVIKLPAQMASVPRMPQLHPEQLTCMARVHQGMDRLQKICRQPKACMYMSIERMETLMSELCASVQLLSNALNLSIEQEHGVGLHKGFQAGYREGFSHGHFMGVQEGRQKTLKKSETLKKETSCQTDNVKVSSQVNLVKASTQTPHDKKATKAYIAIGTQTTYSHTHKKVIGKDFGGSRKMRESAVQASFPEKTYEQWIQEMLNSASGQIFLERVELSLNKALELQKKRLDELFSVKLRHHSEILRLSRRQNSWRTLCRRVERDTESSTEAKNLVHKINRLLHHYESHHRILAEKIHESELAAEQAARIIPIWNEAETGVASGCAGNPQSLPGVGGMSFPIETKTPDANPLLPLSDQPGCSGYAAKNIAVGLRYPYQLLAVAAPELMASQAPVVHVSSTGVDPPITSIPMVSSLNSKAKLDSITNKNASFSADLLNPPVLPLAPSFDEALLSAKNRMLSLERESDLLEQSFVNYFERTCSYKPISSSSYSSGHHIRANCRRERQQIHRTLDGFRDWHRRLHLEDQIEDPKDGQFVASTAEAPLSIPSPTSLPEKEPDSYQFTNAIAVARRKLFNDMTSPCLAQPQSLSGGNSPLLRNWHHSNKFSIRGELTPTEIDVLSGRLSVPPEVALTASNRNDEIKHVINRTQIALDCSWDSSSSSTAASSNSSLITIPQGSNPSRRLQRSMAKMHKLFGGSINPEKRPVSAPPSGTINVIESDTTRPQTAPTMTPVSSSSSPDILYSQEFWKRMHL